MVYDTIVGQKPSFPKKPGFLNIASDQRIAIVIDRWQLTITYFLINQKPQ
jgi:hypothetical protein